MTSLILGIMLGGCSDFGEEAAVDKTHAKNPLLDTRWELVEFQSMDDTIGTLRPIDSEKYTLELNADQSVYMQLNCNRATGTWHAQPGDNPTSGQFKFGPLAMTRALCPAPSMDQQIALQAEYVSSYLLKEGKLYLSLMADGGIYAFKPSDDTLFSTEPDKKLETAILKNIPTYTLEVTQDAGVGRYVYGRVDLNADHKDEVFVYLLGSYFCGTGGCNLLLFKEDRDGYSLINDFPISRLPVLVSEHKTNGWSDIIRLESGGGMPPVYVSYAFDGEHYVEKEHNSAEHRPNGQRYLTGELVFDHGILLKPQH